jgi:Tol biopolymer transport system component
MIIFSSDRSGTMALYVMNADGSDVAQVTFPRPPYMDARAMIARDGKSVVFNRQKGDGTISICRTELSQLKPTQ